MKKILILAVLLVCAFIIWSRLSTPWGEQKVVFEPSLQECFHEPEFNYCIYTSKLGSNGNVAYFLHGRNQDERTWNDDDFYTGQVQKYWQSKNIKPPIIISISFGKFWLLAPKGVAEKSGLQQVFFEKVIPKVEEKIPHPNLRMVFGESMGGLNSIILSLAKPNYFQKVAALCPPIYNQVTPFSSISDIKASLYRTGAVPLVMLGVVRLARAFASSEEEWSKISPIAMLKALQERVQTDYYMSGDLYDKYGGFEGEEAFRDLARERGIRLEWRPIYGGHCAIDVISLADFLIR